MSLTETVAGLESLKELVDKYSPLKFTGSDEARALAEAVALGYGAVEQDYKKYTGPMQVELTDRGHLKVFSNFFEAGWLSGKTVHAAEGYSELLRVLGRARADLAAQRTAPSASLPMEQIWRLLHREVRDVARKRFEDGHFADAVEAAFKALNNEVKRIAAARGVTALDGAALMHSVFSVKSPTIVLADLSTASGRDMQQGFMEMFAGAMMAIRNPKAHDNIVISPERAVHLLFTAGTAQQNARSVRQLNPTLSFDHASADPK
jgi:uncharacterized protein (TIGR02391 family)